MIVLVILGIMAGIAAVHGLPLTAGMEYSRTISSLRVLLFLLARNVAADVAPPAMTSAARYSAAAATIALREVDMPVTIIDARKCIAKQLYRRNRPGRPRGSPWCL